MEEERATAHTDSVLDRLILGLLVAVQGIWLLALVAALLWLFP